MLNQIQRPQVKLVPVAPLPYSEPPMQNYEIPPTYPPTPQTYPQPSQPTYNQPPTYPPTPTRKTYTVTYGDSLQKIAKKCETTVEVLKELNQIFKNALTIGQLLRIP